MMSFFPAQNPPFSQEGHPPKTPPAPITPQYHNHQTDSFALITSSTFSSCSSLSTSSSTSKDPIVCPRAPKISCSSPLEIISLTPSFNLTSSYLSLILRLQNPPHKTQNAIFLNQEATTLWYSPLSTTKNTPENSPIQSTTNNLACTTSQYKKLTKIISKTPQRILLNTNFGNPWYVLEIQETYHGDPHFALVATYPYQLLLSSLKQPSQLFLRGSDGSSNYHLYERFSLTYEVEKLGRLSRVGYLGRGGTEGNIKCVFIKMLDLDAEPEGRGGITDRETASNLMEEIEHIYHEINLLCGIPLHPHITLPPTGYITLGSQEGGTREGRKIIGFIGEYYKNGRLSDYLFLPGEPGKPRTLRPITLLQKAKWALQITSTIIHLHRKAGISMGDGGRGFGLERFLVDDFLQLHLTGFGAGEKVPRFSWRVPPEARIRGEWDVSVENINGKESYGIKKLIWKRNNYSFLRREGDNLIESMDVARLGPKLSSTLIPSAINTKVESPNNNGGGNTNEGYDSNAIIMEESTQAGGRGIGVNDSKGHHREKETEEAQFIQKERTSKIDKDWSVFEEWRSIPRALEIVETYSLGVMLWLLFEQIPSDSFSGDGGETLVSWTERGQIPGEWRALVEACVETDPADRIGLGEVLRTFVAEVGKRWDGGWFMG